MTKYQPLSEQLAAHLGDAWRVSFGEIEAVLGFPLPKAARSGRVWWGNDRARAHSRAWADHGWEVWDVDLAGEAVGFRRKLAQPAASQIQPPALRRAAILASGRAQAARAAQGVGLVAAGLALGIGVGLLAFWGLTRREASAG